MPQRKQNCGRKDWKIGARAENALKSSWMQWILPSIRRVARPAPVFQSSVLLMLLRPGCKRTGTHTGIVYMLLPQACWACWVSMWIRLQGREHILISGILEHYWQLGQNLGLPELIMAIQTPPMEKVGVMDLESFYPAKDRFALAMKLNGLLASPGFKAWLEG